MRQADRAPWFVLGDLNGFFGLMFDNLTVLSFLAGILIFGFGFPADIVYGRMFPGTAFGVLAGDLAYTWMAWRLARQASLSWQSGPFERHSMSWGQGRDGACQHSGQHGPNVNGEGEAVISRPPPGESNGRSSSRAQPWRRRGTRR